jgi:hypothetical protein
VKAGQGLGQEHHRGAGRDGHRHPASERAAHLLDFLAQAIEVLRDALRTRQHGAPVGRERGATRGAIDQWDAQGRFQLLQGIAKSGLRHAHAARRRAHAAVLGNRDQDTKMLQLH